MASFARQSYGGAFQGGVPAFKVLPAPGGVFHIYPDGRKVYVKAGASAAAAPAAVSPSQAQQAAAAALTPDSTYITNTAQNLKAQADLGANFQSGENARLAARAAIQAGAPIDDAAQQAALADRQVGSDTNAADQGTLVPPARQVTPPAPAAPTAKTPKARLSRSFARRSWGGAYGSRT